MENKLLIKRQQLYYFPDLLRNDLQNLYYYVLGSNNNNGMFIITYYTNVERGKVVVALCNKSHITYLTIIIKKESWGIFNRNEKR
jgi:hypothetical protein